MYAAQLKSIVTADPLRLRVLHLVRDLNLPDCWVAAGFVRSAVWDHLHQRHTAIQAADIDVIWFDASAPKAMDSSIEIKLCRADNTLDWSVKNQAHMHVRNGDALYTSATEAMMHWPETATAVAVRLNKKGALEVAAPFGLDDLFGLVVRPTPTFEKKKRHIYLKRAQTKH